MNPPRILAARLGVLLSGLLAMIVLASCKDDPTVTIRGRIINGDSTSILDVSHVVVTDSVIIGISETNGNYTINGVESGTYILQPHKDGLRFDPASQTLVINGSDVQDVDFRAYAEGGGEVVDLDSGYVSLPGGTFTMGSNNGYAEEQPVHQVTVGPFIMAKYEVRQREWLQVMSVNPSLYIGDNLPVERVSWYNAVAYCNGRSIQEGLQPVYTINGTNIICDFSKNGYRLPTEAEWEYACRAGTTTDFYSGNLSSRLKTCIPDQAIDAIGWYCQNATRTQVVGQKNPNPYGLYDITGNVFEWCWDWNGQYPSTLQVNPKGPGSGSAKICRGGSFFYEPMRSRSAFRLAYDPTSEFAGVGLRLVRSR